MAKTIKSVEDLTQDPRNARRRTERSSNMLHRSMEDVGFSRSIVVDEDGVILAGNGATEAAIDAGITNVKVVDADGNTIIAVRRSGLTDEQKIQLSLYDNRTAELSEWDILQLAELEKEFNIEDIFTQEDMEELGKTLEKELSNFGGDRGDNNEMPESLTTEPRCKVGEIWALGRHHLLCGDSCDRHIVGELLNGKTPGLIWSDPPYKCQKKDGRIGGGGKSIDAKQYPIIANDETTEIAVDAFDLYHSLFPDAVHIWWGANHYCSALPDSSCWIVWDKKNGDSAFADCELAWTNQDSAVRKFSFLWNGFSRQGEASGTKRVHPNQKPVEMVEWFWNEYCSNETLCFDPFLGSGTSIIAAQKYSDRIVYGCELMPQYCEVIFQRYEQMTGEKVSKIP